MPLTGRMSPPAPRRHTRRRLACPLRVEALEDRTLLSGSSLALPVYLEVDPTTDAITRLPIPYITRVARISYSTKGTY